MNTVANKSLLIIDDHPVYRDALSEKLVRELMADDIEVAVASRVNEGLDLIQHTNRHWVILLDVMMPGLSGLPAIKVFKEQRNVKHVAAISGLDEHTWETKTVAAGAALYLSKNSTAELIIRKIKPLFDLAAQDIASKQHREPKEFRLTQRQLQVLDLISKGHSNKVIADYLDISEQAVKIHINLLFKELRVFNRTQAVLMAQKHQLLP